MRCINKDFHRKKIQLLPMLTEKEAQSLASTEEDKSLPRTNSRKVMENILPSFSATNSLVCNADLTRTNIYSTPLIPGPASSYSAIYTALIRAYNISTWCCGDTTKTVISLNLDLCYLFMKCYLFVRTNTALKDKFILFLGELHVAFAHVRAIGTFTNGSGLEKAWQVAGWFNNSAVVREIMECTYIKRGVATHEQSALAIQYLLLKELTESGDLYITEGITSYIETANRALEKTIMLNFKEHL